MKMKQRLLAIVCALFAMQTMVWAQEASGYCGDPSVNEGKDVKWELSADGVLTISGVGAVKNCTWDSSAPWTGYQFTSVVVKEGITKIGLAAFYYCSGFTSITLPNSLTSIGNSAFYMCSDLTGITFPDSLMSIGESAFAECSGLTSITFPNSLTSIGNGAFNTCTSLTSITLPNSVTNIGESVFSRCSGLTSVTMGNSVTNIGSGAFKGCSSLSFVTCLNPVPPTLDNSFDDISENATLRVPDMEAYKASDWAQFFTKIEQIDLTAIRGIEAGKKNIPTTIHDLGGRRVTEPVKGRIYIVDGKTVVW